MVGPIRHPLLRWLIYGHLWLALAVAAQTLWTGFFLHEGTPVARYALAAALGAYTAYGVMRLARARGPEHERYPNLLWYARHRTLLTVLVGTAGVAAFVLLWPLWPVAWPWLLPAIVLAFFYVTPFTTAKGVGIGLRSIPFFKAFLIAVLWAVVTVAVPMCLDPAGYSHVTIAMKACQRVPLILALAIAFDIRDLADDEPSLRTVPLVFGVRGAKAIALVLLAFSALFEVISLRVLDHLTASWTVLIGYVYGAVLVVRARPVRDPIYYAFFVDGTMVLIPLCVWVGMAY